MGNKANAKRLLDAIEQVLSANRNVVEVLTEVAGNEVEKPEELKEAMDAFGSLVQGFFGMNVAMKKLREGLVKGLEKEDK
jgi:hypothetical protein